MEKELESGNSLIGSTRGFERNRGSERDRGSKRNKYCSIGKITSTVLIIAHGSTFSVLLFELVYLKMFYKINDSMAF